MKKDNNTNTSYSNTNTNTDTSFYTFIRCKCKKPSFFRSSHPEMFCKKGVLRNFAKFKGKYQCQSLRDFGTGVFLRILWNFYKNLLLQKTSGGCFCLFMTPFHCIISNFEKKKCFTINRRLFPKVFRVASFFHERVNRVKNGT